MKDLSDNMNSDSGLEFRKRGTLFWLTSRAWICMIAEQCKNVMVVIFKSLINRDRYFIATVNLRKDPHPNPYQNYS